MNTLLWVDINMGHVHATNLDGHDTILHAAPTSVGFVAPLGNNQHVLGRRSDLVKLTGWANEQTIGVLQLESGQRINDGKLSPDGSLVFGTLKENSTEPENSLMFVHPDGSTTEAGILQSAVHLSNGLTWSKDGSTLYYVDTPTLRVDAFDFHADGARPVLSNRRAVATFPERFGFPDGMTIDDDGCLWVAFWDGAAVRRVTPAGKIDLTVELPASKPTCPAFGPDGQLFVTSARQGDSLNPSDGSVFVIE